MIIPTKEQEIYFEKANVALSKELNYTDIWDPTNKIPSKEKIINANKKTKAQQLYVEDNIDEIQRTNKISKTIRTILGIVFLILYILLRNSTNANILLPILTLFIPISLVLMFIFKTKNIRKIAKDIVKLEVAQKNNYLYDPDENYERYTDYKQKFPEAFNRGDKNQNIEDVFWGTHNKNNKKHYFTTGIFNYAQYEGSGKNKRLKYYTDHYFAIKLPNQIKTKFALVPNNKIFNFFSNKKIKTESKKFNDTYTTKYEGTKEEKELEITRILSPKVQEEILNLEEHNKQKKINKYKQNKQAKGTTIIIDKDTILFYLPGTLMKKIKTTFKKNMNIHEEDLQEINNELNKLIKISTEITKHIN